MTINSTCSPLNPHRSIQLDDNGNEISQRVCIHDPQPYKIHSQEVVCHYVKKLEYTVKELDEIIEAIEFKKEQEHVQATVEYFKERIRNYSKPEVKLPDSECELRLLSMPMDQGNPFYEQYTKDLNNPDKAKFNRMVTRRNSLFLHRRDLSFMQKMEVIKLAQNMNKIKVYNNPERFEYKFGITQPLADKTYKVIYKSPKNVSMDSYAFILRSALYSLRLKHIILPRRELVMKRFIPTNGKKGYETAVFIEENIDHLVEFRTCCEKYKSNPESFDVVIKEFVKLSCKVDIGDLMGGIRERNQLYGSAGVLIVDGKVHDTKHLTLPFWNFDNLGIQIVPNKDGSETYNLVLLDIDVIRKPNHTTVEILMLMFPDHRQLVLDTIIENNKDLLKGYNPYCPTRCDRVISDYLKLSTSERRSSYMKNSKKIVDDRERCIQEAKFEDCQLALQKRKEVLNTQEKEDKKD